MASFFHSGRKQKDATTPNSDVLGVPGGSTTPSSSPSRSNTPIAVDGPKKGFRASLRDRFSGLYSKRVNVNLPDDPNYQRKLDAIDYSIQVLDIFDELSKVIALVVPDALGLALEKITAVLQQLKKMMENKQAWKELLMSIDERQRGFNDQLSGVQAHELPQKLVSAMKQYAQSLEKLAARVMEQAGILQAVSLKESRFIRIKKFADQFLHADSHADDIKAYEAELTIVMDEVKTSLTIYIAITVNRIDRKADNLKALIFLEGSSSAPERNPLGTKHKSCLEGTRIDVLEDIRHWYRADAASKTPVYCIGDVAGTGKSTISHTMAEEWSAKQCFVFFFSNTFAHEARTLCISFAKQIIGSCHGPDWDEYWASLSSELSSPIAQSVENLWDRLVFQPLKKCTKHERHVVVVDALDECDQTTRGPLLKCLLDACSSGTKSNIRLLLTTRKEDDISNILDEETYRETILPRSLLDSNTSQADIERYLKHRLNKGKVRLTIEQRDQLARRCGGLFIFASLACGILERGLSKYQAKRLQEILGNFTSLHTLYHQTLYQAEDSSEDTREMLNRILGVILVAREPLSIVTIAALLSEPVEDVGLLIRRLGSILGSGTVEQPVYILHATLKEFLVQESWTDKEKDPKSGRDTARDMQNQYYIRESESHLIVLKGCLSNIMAKELVFNICQLETSSLMNEQVTDMDERIKRWISNRLRYSCLNWASHLESTKFDEEILGHLQYFMNDQFLYWLEILSVTKCVRFASKMLFILTKWMRTNNRDEILPREMHKFAATFASVIAQSAPHIHISALPFAPQSSPLSKRYIKQYPRTLMVQTGGLGNWPSTQNVSFGHTDMVTSVAFSPDGRYVVSGSSDNTIRIWDAETGEAVGAPFMGHTDRIASVAFSHDGKYIVSGSDDKTVRVWNAESGEVVAAPFEGHTNEVTSIAFSPDGKCIVSGSEDNTIRVWNVQSGEAVGAPFEGHISGVNSVAFSPDGKRIVSCSLDRAIRVWDAESGEAVDAPPWGYMNSPASVALSLDGKHIVCGSWDKTIWLWNAVTGEAVGAPLKGHTSGVSSVAFSPDGKHIVSGSEDMTVRVWNVESQTVVGAPFEGHTSKVKSVAFSPDGKRIVSGSSDNTVRVWNLESEEAVRALFEGHTSFVKSVAFSPDGKRIVSGSSDDTVRVWNAHSGEVDGVPFEGHTNVVTSVAFSPDGKCIVSGSDDKTVRIWNTESGAAVGAPFKGHTGAVKSVAFSPDSRRILSGSLDCTIRVWDAESGEAVEVPYWGHLTSVAFSLDGRYIVSACWNRSISVWNVETRASVGAPLKGHIGWVNSVAFSPDGKHIVSGSGDKTVLVWNVESGEVVVVGAPFEGHTSGVNSVAFSPDGKHIVSGSEDKTVRMWDAGSGEAVGAPFEGHTNPVTSVAFSPDGRRIVSGSDDATVRVWNLDRCENVSVG